MLALNIDWFIIYNTILQAVMNYNQKLFSIDANSSTSQPQFFPSSDLVNKVTTREQV